VHLKAGIVAKLSLA